MALTVGTRLGAYEVTGSLGAGGMGEVYRATDTKLGRDLAIKTLPAALASDEDRLARFEREAKLLAALNHAHIASVYSLDEHDGTQYLAMELVEGETLEEKLKRGPLPIEDALHLALQIAEALEAAHEKGVVHRDLKPANIMVTAAGQVKVLDFGLAKAFSGGPNEASPLHSPALSLAMTQQGLILGTAGYMSPEQASGQATDQRADVWAFGVVLYEMLTGLPLFSGESVPHILAAVLQTEPDWGRLPKNLHPRVRQLLERCLEKKVRNRYHSIADARVDIERVLSDPAGVTPQVAAQAAAAPRSIRMPLAAMFVLGAVLAGALAWTIKPAPSPAPVNRFEYVLPSDQTLRNTDRLVMALSPDGRHFVYNTEDGLYVRSMDELDARPIPGTEEELANPVFSPDGQSVVYLTFGGLKRIALSGGAPVVITGPINSFSASWSADGTIFYTAVEGIFRVPASGGTPELVIEKQRPGELFQGSELLPDGDSVLFTVATGPAAEGQIVAQSLSTGKRTVLVETGAEPHYVPTGHLIYAVGDSLFAVAFDANTLTVSGAPVSLVQGIMRSSATLASANYGIARDGTLAYVVGSGVPQQNKTLVWVDREGNETPLDLEPRMYAYPRLSPDGSRLALVTRGARDDIWIYDLSRAVLTRLTVSSEGVAPVWSPDGSRLAYGSADATGVPDVVWQPADGSAEPEAITGTATPGGPGLNPRAISPDGKRLLLSDRNEARPAGRDISVLVLDGQSDVQPLIATPASDRTPAVSPNGRWLAYDSDESGQSEIYVRPFPEVGSSRTQVSSGGGQDPVWSRDGRELFYWVDPGTVMGVTVETEASFSASRPRVIVKGDYVQDSPSPQYDVSADGQRFLMIKPAATDLDAAPTRIVIVQNFFEELKRLVPTK